ncbi:NADP-dependent oxidoreductase domain-containing protein 1-like [Dendronephthya gigantea]|uniref:NADP-dependent oxidoreductase domain-containing protein 1-like n=1 Tax=Dendronephthya gigantea TaxID=151771 RepID=UPI00106A36DC|nr:NADP-dependent oxidoreductase domain-containing protein 1-like [Dendronephthya gigantea]
MIALEDVTKNLPSLQFDSALPDDERRALIQLRTKSLVSISTACAQSIYFVSILNKVNEVILKKTRSLNNNSCITSVFSGLKIGIIGCGRLGRELASVLLNLGVVKASHLYISTRCPENLEEFQDKGTFCCFDNSLVGRTVDILFLCCLPSQFTTVSKDLRSNLNGVVFSFVSGLPLARISQLLDYQNIISPTLTFKSNIAEIFEDSNPWKFGIDIMEILADQNCIIHTSPSYTGEDALLEMDVNLLENIIFAVLNECTRHGIGCQEAVRLCNSILFALTPEHPSYFVLNDILRVKDSKENTGTKDMTDFLPIFDLVKMKSEETSVLPLGKRIVEDESLRTAFADVYQNVFQKCVSV